MTPEQKAAFDAELADFDRDLKVITDFQEARAKCPRPAYHKFTATCPECGYTP